MSLFQDTHFWVLIAFAAAFFIGFKYGRKSVLSALDSRSNEIRNRIEEAEKLRIEAQEMLSEFRKKSHDAMKEADLIIKEAGITVAKYREKSLEEIRERIALMEEQAKIRLIHEQENAVFEIREKVTEEAVRAASDTLRKTLNSEDISNLNTVTLKRIGEYTR